MVMSSTRTSGLQEMVMKLEGKVRRAYGVKVKSCKSIELLGTSNEK